MSLSLSTLGAGLGLAVAAICLVSIALKTFGSTRPPLPPGPKGLPLVGNLKDLPPAGEYESHHWIKHKALYGPISSVTVMGQPLIILNDPQIAKELLNNRSAKHSARPKQVFAGELVGWENLLGFSSDQKRVRLYRRNMSRVIGSEAAVPRFDDFQEEEVAHFLLHLLEDPDNFITYIKKEAGSLILRITYNYTAESHKSDYLVDLAGDSMDKFSKGGGHGAFIVDMLPFLKHLPAWMPGAGFKKTAREWAGLLNQVAEKPYSFVKHQIAQGTHQTSFLAELLAAGEPTPEKEFTDKWSAMSLYLAGADTTVSSVSYFFLAMMMNPEVQRKAQDEIERVIGRDRIPKMKDRKNLPYIEALLKEILRWRPVAPMLFPHATSEDDIYDGYLIPKGSLLLTNVWHFTQNPEIYAEPSAFRPERFLKTEKHEPELDPGEFAFGYGRRVCPGRVLAESSLYLNIAQVLAVYNIGPPIENGKEVEQDVKLVPGIINHPPPFKISLKPRSPHHKVLIEDLAGMYPWRESDGPALASLST